MRFLGLLFIGIGLLLFCTFIFMVPGLIAIGVGALLYMAGGKRTQSPVQAPPRHWTTRDTLLVSAVTIILVVGMVLYHPAPQLKARQVLPVPRTEQNRVHPVRHAETPKASQGR